MILIRIFNLDHKYITAQKFDTFTEAQNFLYNNYDSNYYGEIYKLVKSDNIYSHLCRLKGVDF